MDYRVIEKIRKELEEELKQYDIEKGHIHLNIPSKVLEQIIFKYNKVRDCLEFAFDFEQIKKLDLSSISFDDVKVFNKDFSNSKGVKINPQTVHEKNLMNTVLKDVEIIGLFDDVKIVGASFKGSTGAYIDLRIIYGNNARNVDFCDAFVLHPRYTGVVTTDANFKGSLKSIELDEEQLLSEVKKIGQKK
jgi:uncharacterized protein YjbI with pentapeptide repeats